MKWGDYTTSLLTADDHSTGLTTRSERELAKKDNHMSLQRIHQLNQLTERSNLDCVAIMPGPNMPYFTDLSFHLSERPTVALFPLHGQPALVLPAFEATKTERSPIDWQTFILQLISFGQDNNTMVTRLPLNNDNTGQWDIPLSTLKQAVIVISPTALKSSEPALFQWSITEK